MKGSPKSERGQAAMQSNQSLPLHPSRPCTTADCVMKFFTSGFPGSITGTFLSLYFESKSKTLNIEPSVATGRNGAHLYDFRIVFTWIQSPQIPNHATSKHQVELTAAYLKPHFCMVYRKKVMNITGASFPTPLSAATPPATAAPTAAAVKPAMAAGPVTPNATAPMAPTAPAPIPAAVAVLADIATAASSALSSTHRMIAA